MEVHLLTESSWRRWWSFCCWSKSSPNPTGSAGGAGLDVTPIFGPGLPNSGVYAGGGGGMVNGPSALLQLE
jgi:hypothetical protein